jgi:hypothetical protein
VDVRNANVARNDEVSARNNSAVARNNSVGDVPHSVVARNNSVVARSNLNFENKFLFHNKLNIN